MTKVGLVQTIQYDSNQKGIESVSKRLRELGKQETEIVCLPEQWLKNNKIEDFNSEFAEFMKIAQEYSMTVITGHFMRFQIKKHQLFHQLLGQMEKLLENKRKFTHLTMKKTQ